MGPPPFLTLPTSRKKVKLCTPFTRALNGEYVCYALEVFPLAAHTKDPLLSNNTTAALLGFVVYLLHTAGTDT